METSLTLKRQLEIARLERALEIAEGMALRKVNLTTTELARLNNILTGSEQNSDPWRIEAVTIQLPSGKKETLSLIQEPSLNIRDILHKCTDLSETGSLIDAVVLIYSKIVLSHFFKDANRRTAVVACHYFLSRYEAPISGLALHELGLGDLRQPEQLELLKNTIQHLTRFASARQKNKKNGDDQLH